MGIGWGWLNRSPHPTKQAETLLVRRRRVDCTSLAVHLLRAITGVRAISCNGPIYRSLIRYAPLRRSRLRPFQLKLMMPSAIISSIAAWTAGIASRHGSSDAMARATSLGQIVAPPVRSPSSCKIVFRASGFTWRVPHFRGSIALVRTDPEICLQAGGGTDCARAMPEVRVSRAQFPKDRPGLLSPSRRNLPARRPCSALPFPQH